MTTRDERILDLAERLMVASMRISPEEKQYDLLAPEHCLDRAAELHDAHAARTQGPKPGTAGWIVANQSKIQEISDAGEEALRIADELYCQPAPAAPETPGTVQVPWELLDEWDRGSPANGIVMPNRDAERRLREFIAAARGGEGGSNAKA